MITAPEGKCNQSSPATAAFMDPCVSLYLGANLIYMSPDFLCAPWLHWLMIHICRCQDCQERFQEKEATHNSSGHTLVVSGSPMSPQQLAFERKAYFTLGRLNDYRIRIKIAHFRHGLNSRRSTAENIWNLTSRDLVPISASLMPRVSALMPMLPAALLGIRTTFFLLKAFPANVSHQASLSEH